jgi:hypothetical protein
VKVKMQTDSTPLATDHFPLTTVFAGPRTRDQLPLVAKGVWTKDEPGPMKKAKLSKLLKTKDYSGYPKANLSNSLKTKDRVLGRIFC